jgi:hypothetical protein
MKFTILALLGAASAKIQLPEVDINRDGLESSLDNLKKDFE